MTGKVSSGWHGDLIRGAEALALEWHGADWLATKGMDRRGAEWSGQSWIGMAGQAGLGRDGQELDVVTQAGLGPVGSFRIG